MAAYNKVRFVKELLQKTEGKPPSFLVNLYPDHWSLNDGSRFHYHIPMASLLDDIRAQRIPVDFLEIFDNARVPFYEGCMVVQILDYRPQNPKENILEKPEQTRVVLHPNSESLWADICLLNQQYGTRWTDKDALEVEARISLATTPPLCLDPDPHLARVANHVMRASIPPIPSSLKRKAAAMEPEDDENDKARRIKIIQHMATRPNRPNPSFHLFDALQKAKSQKSSSPVQPQPPPSQINTNPSSTPGTPTVNGVQAHSPRPPSHPPVQPQPLSQPQVVQQKPTAAVAARLPQAHQQMQLSNQFRLQQQPPTTQRPPSRTHQPLPPQRPQTPNHQPQPPAAQHPQQPQQPLTQSQPQTVVPHQQIQLLNQFRLHQQQQPPTTQHPPSRTPQPLPPQRPRTPSHQPQPPAAQHPQQPLTQSQIQMYAQMYGYPQMQFNVAQGGGARMPASYWSSMGNMAGIPGIQGIQGMPGMQGVQGIQGMQGMGRGLPTAAAKLSGMAAAGVGAVHIHGAGGVGPMQGKTAVPGGVQR